VQLRLVSTKWIYLSRDEARSDSASTFAGVVVGWVSLIAGVAWWYG